MSALQRRVFIAIDEWLWIALCVYLHRVNDPWFARTFWFGVVANYVIAYPWHWYWSWYEAKAFADAFKKQLAAIEK